MRGPAHAVYEADFQKPLAVAALFLRMMQVVWIARHGNRQDFVDPHWRDAAERPYDPGLSEDGVEQARRLGGRLAAEGITRIYASPFLRTVETAHYVAERTGAPILLEWGLAEWMNPEWFPRMPETLPPEALAARFPEIDPTHASLALPRYPETAEEAWGRVQPVARALAARHTEPILLVGHGASVTAAAQGLVQGLALFECALCSVVKAVREDGMWRAELCGDVSHLAESVGARRFA